MATEADDDGGLAPLCDSIHHRVRSRPRGRLRSTDLQNGSQVSNRFAGRKAYTLLCVDAHIINLRLMSKICEKWGQPCETARNGQEAVEIYKRDPDRFRCILMDVTMPVVDGFEATRRIREFEEDSWASFIASQSQDIPTKQPTSSQFEYSSSSSSSSAPQVPNGKPVRRVVVIALMASLVSLSPATIAETGFDLVMRKPIHLKTMADLLFGAPETNVVSLYGGVSETALREAGYPLRMGVWHPRRDPEPREAILGSFGDM
ncbi:uncharacterized protein BCR38DRAFT_151611 [Pseudomassariella vexata]|uniref:Response regulatory domain-containing protein n=1 Tax=Pseudomassariella vexata TaxID=1141098 RepID=A0A1Y2E6C3_9PEZI|nr:uncharacterized protein BCR38DRAFT_151611 [Pseudomassariella vexata]ORY67118.1 hypothetical protein BCR38DRAFT_151611 [Pseudomassariella vexata]